MHNKAYEPPTKELSPPQLLTKVSKQNKFEADMQSKTNAKPIQVPSKAFRPSVKR